MGRPRKGTDVRVAVSFRLQPRLIAEIDRQAKRRGTTRTALIEDVLDFEFLVSPPPRSFIVQPVGRPLIEVLADDKLTCTHPKKMVTPHPYMTVCDPSKGGCGARLR